jgi:virginiamycin B lyase
MRTPTKTEHLKLRPRALAPLVLGALAMTLCGSAVAAVSPPAPAENVSVVGYQVSTKVVATAGVGSSTTQVAALAAAPDGSDAEWFVVNGGRQDLLLITPAGTQKLVAKAAFRSDNGPPVTYVSVDADGYDWILDNDQSVPENTLYAVGGSTSETPGPSAVSSFDGYAQDMALGADGALYISDDAGNLIRCQITAQPSASCTSFPLSANFDGGAYAVGAGGTLAWFTDAAGELGAVNGQGTISGPFADPRARVGALSTDPGTIVAASNGLVYAAGGAEGSSSGANNEILTFDPASPSSAGALTTALSNVVALTIGPDGNVWFLDAGANGGTGAVGRITIATGAVVEYPLPSGVSLPSSGARIAAGPAVPDQNGDGEVFFNATTTVLSGSAGTGIAVVGEVTGIPFPIVAGGLQFKPQIDVSKRRAAVLTLTCVGPANAECSGNLKLKLRVPKPLGQSLGAVAYELRGGGTERRTVRLSRKAFGALEHVAGRQLTASVSVRARVGTVSGRALTMIGPAPRRRRRGG